MDNSAFLLNEFTPLTEDKRKGGTGGSWLLEQYIDRFLKPHLELYIELKRSCFEGL